MRNLIGVGVHCVPTSNFQSVSLMCLDECLDRCWQFQSCPGCFFWIELPMRRCTFQLTRIPPQKPCSWKSLFPQPTGSNFDPDKKNLEQQKPPEHSAKWKIGMFTQSSLSCYLLKGLLSIVAQLDLFIHVDCINCWQWKSVHPPTKTWHFPPLDGNLPGHRPNLKMATLISPTESRTKILEKFGDSPTPKPTSPHLSKSQMQIIS